MEIAKYLKAGRMTVNAIEKQIEIANKSLIIPYYLLEAQDWGPVYEKYVGQILEDDGYEVKYNGLEKGKLDRGIDLIALKDDHIYFIQCKYTIQILSKARIEWILNKASNILFENYKNYHRKTYFTLIVNDIDVNFSKRKPKGFKLTYTDISKVKHPILQYFLDHNHIQDKVKLEVREIKMVK